MHRRIPGVARIAAFAVVAFAAASAVSCAGAPPAKVPGWVTQTPANDATYTWFVGSAEGSSIAKATEVATSGLIAEVTRYMGVTITAQSSATARATLDSFQADLVQTVTQTSTSRVAGFQVVEKYVAGSEAAPTVYLLARYATKDLESEKKRIAAVFQEKVDAVAKPEAMAKGLLEDGDVIGAVRKFIEAAAAASGSDVENAEIKFERNINAAKNAVARLGIKKLNDRLEANPGAAFAAPFKALVSAGEQGAADVPVIVGYQTKLPNGRLGTKTVALVSGPDGAISFDHPSPDFVGKATLTMRLDLSAATEALLGVGDKFLPMVAGLEDEIASKRVSFEYTVKSLARAVPTAVLLVDLDASGTASVGTSSSALLQTLSRNGFIVSAAPLKADAIVGQDDTAVLEAARAALAGKADRFAYGTTRVASVKDDRGQKIATVSADVKVVELSGGRMLYSTVKQASAVASSEAEAVESARRTLAQKTVGEDLAASLP